MKSTSRQRHHRQQHVYATIRKAYPSAREPQHGFLPHATQSCSRLPCAVGVQTSLMCRWPRVPLTLLQQFFLSFLPRGALALQSVFAARFLSQTGLLNLRNAAYHAAELLESLWSRTRDMAGVDTLNGVLPASPRASFNLRHCDVCTRDSTVPIFFVAARVDVSPQSVVVSFRLLSDGRICKRRSFSGTAARPLLSALPRCRRGPDDRSFPGSSLT